jgi:hypothetical protein
MVTKLLDFSQKKKGGHLSFDAILPDGSKKYFETDYRRSIHINIDEETITTVIDGEVRQIHPLGTRLKNVKVT